MQKKLLSILLSLTMLIALTVPAFAAVEDTGFVDVAADAWYTEAVAYCREHGLMNGTSDTTFEPESNLTRAMLVTVLYRSVGSPAVTGTDNFTDTVDEAYYADAVVWASQQNIVSGYGNGLFGTNDPVTREQMTVIFWRYAGSPESSGSHSFSDAGSVSSYAVSAVNWADENGIIGATYLWRYLHSWRNTIFPAKRLSPLHPMAPAGGEIALHPFRTLLAVTPPL